MALGVFCHGRPSLRGLVPNDAVKLVHGLCVTVGFKTPRWR
jgi:hypothetical protein